MHVHVYTFYACACACVQNTFEFADVGTRLGMTRASTSENIADAHVSLRCESLEPVRTSCGCRPCGNVLFDLCGYVRGSAVPQRSAMRKYRNRRYGMHVHVRVFLCCLLTISLARATTDALQLYPHIRLRLINYVRFLEWQYLYRVLRVYLITLVIELNSYR